MLYYWGGGGGKWALLEPGSKRAPADLSQKITQIWHFVK